MSVTSVPARVSASVAVFPAGLEAMINPYWRRLRAALEAQGVEFDESPDADLRVRWLWTNRGRVDVLHFHFIQNFYAYEGVHARLRWLARFARNLLLARALGYRTVFTLHNLHPDYPLHPAWADYLGHWMAITLTSGVIVHCQEAGRQLTARFGRRRGVHVMPHPNFIEAYPNTISRAAARAELGLADEQIAFCFVGGIRLNKGLETLIRAFTRTPGDTLRLIIAGAPWPPLEQVDRLRELTKPDPRIVLRVREVPEAEMQVYLNAADAVVLPFQSILTSGSTIMAMGFGKPVVVPALGCIPELVTSEVGFLYDPGDPHGLSAALVRCAAADLPRIGERARQKVQALTWAALARQTLAVYRGEAAIGVPSGHRDEQGA